MAAASDDLKQLLLSRAGFEVVDGSASDNQVRLVGRVPPNASSYWVIIVHRMLVTCENAPWKVDISRQYFLRHLSSGPKLFYAWRLIFQAPQIQAHIPHIMQTIQTTPRPSRVELQEFPLAGVSASRNQLVNGKGAGSVDRTPIGPMAANNARMGGG